jgi:hypothetical protein
MGISKNIGWENISQLVLFNINNEIIDFSHHIMQGVVLCVSLSMVL